MSLYLTLFNLSSVAMPGWLLLILLPGWRVTRRLAEWQVFPIYLAALYAVGIVPILVGYGLGVVRDFGNAEGVQRLLANSDIALVAWIHILAFDQVVGLLIYRENMADRYVSLPVQSVLLFVTLMFGPIGYLTYAVVRQMARRRKATASQAALAAHQLESPSPYVTPTVRSAFGLLWSAWTQEAALFWTGVAGLVLGGAGLVVMAVHGPLIAPEGELSKAVSFNVAVGIYALTIALFVPLARFSPRGLRWWRATQIGMALCAYALENIQIARGLDPRFTQAGGVVDKLMGPVFLFIALGLIAAFLILAVALFRRRESGDEGLVLLGVRYACAATILPAFASGLWMSFIQSRQVGTAGNILPLHALGFHGLQALPLLALFLCWGHVPAALARRLVHVGGIAYLAACAGLAWQTLVGRAVTEPAPGMVLSGLSLFVWLAVTFWAASQWLRALRPLPSAQAQPSA
jgi:hypothetical protein